MNWFLAIDLLGGGVVVVLLYAIIEADNQTCSTVFNNKSYRFILNYANSIVHCIIHGQLHVNPLAKRKINDHILQIPARRLVLLSSCQIKWTFSPESSRKASYIRTFCIGRICTECIFSIFSSFKDKTHGKSMWCLKLKQDLLCFLIQ